MSRGRPTLRTPALLDRIIRQIEAGATLAQACSREGLRPKTFRHWLRFDPDLHARVLRARAKSLSH